MKKLIRRGVQGPGSSFIEPLEWRVLLSGSPPTGIKPFDSMGNPPQAVVSAPVVTADGQATETVSITYTSDTTISLSTITIANITVTEEGTLGPTALVVTGVTTNPNVGSPTSV